MGLISTIIVAIVQGVTELFPISSLGHAVVLPPLMRLSDMDIRSEAFLPLLVVLHLGTAIALMLYFWRDWLSIAAAFFDRDPKTRREQFGLLWLVIVGTIPAVIAGFLLERHVREMFGSAYLAAFFLIVNGVLLFAVERMKQEGRNPISALTLKDAAIIGLWQCLALIPGISRSGATIAGGLLLGLSHEAAARFSLLLATPIIFGAGVLEVPKLMKSGFHVTGIAVIGGVVAGVTAFIATAILMRWMKSHEFKALDPFAYYCVGFGALSLILLAV
ncbi:MAG: undecaprenyl-diphosphate phosphatase [Hyphomicrobiales bacterium]|nr:undecaprenyl-diphosphate phosphatase [Hyphomicrobiales bacterium]MBV8426872.1 undecaprenyl-diphosphate phosphatase [Hyphomicrobiales bacterium]MBV8767143.1 undecaprenyl-diphosphate phosphatase [Hyphomicrobiales bacterium]MBV9434058.1 undecaprenyl-diphosphate phosphatase [Hyphomicrobiales bacterium]MBW0004416.1 undecaprenyl-diphosphate phosphatase [Hyphomicrobiales bacterium]